MKISDGLKYRFWMLLLFAVVVIAPCSIFVWITGFASPFDLFLVGMCTTGIFNGVFSVFALARMSEHERTLMAERGGISQLFWLAGAGVIVPIFVKSFMVCAVNGHEVAAVAILLGGFPLLASVLIITHFYRRRRRSDALRVANQRPDGPG